MPLLASIYYGWHIKPHIKPHIKFQNVR